MARIIKEHAVRRNEILDATGKLIYSKGYEQMTIQDILDDLQIAKGTFYHYFGSKQELLEALIERMQKTAKLLLEPIVYNTALSALAKFQHFFATLARWKTEQKTFLLAVLRVWYTDENVLVRHKLHVAGVKWITPFFAVIIRQGIEEGVFSTNYPEHVSEVVVHLLDDMNASLADVLLTFDAQRDDAQTLERIVAAYTEAVERVLGAPASSLSLVDDETLREWVVAIQ